MSIVAGGVQFLIRARVLFAMGALALVLNVHPVEAATCTMTPGVVNATAFQNLLNSCEGQTITFASGFFRVTWRQTSSPLTSGRFRSSTITTG